MSRKDVDLISKQLAALSSGSKPAGEGRMKKLLSSIEKTDAAIDKKRAAIESAKTKLEDLKTSLSSLEKEKKEKIKELNKLEASFLKATSRLIS
jgi:chromosome segregation ATPase